MQLLKQGNLPKTIAVFTAFSVMTAGIFAGCSKADQTGRQQKQANVEKADTLKKNQDIKTIEYLQRIRD